MQSATSNPLLVRGLILISSWSRTSEHERSLVERFFRLAEAEDMSTHTVLFLRYDLPSTLHACRVQEVERLGILAMEQNAKAVAYTWAACMSSEISDRLGAIQPPGLVVGG